MSLVSDQIVGFLLICSVLIGASWNADLILLLTLLVLCTLIINIHICGCVIIYQFPIYITLSYD